MSDDQVTFTVDDVELSAPKGSMLIQATDKAGIHIPRFCYHDKLSVAANCRMCLVDVEKAPKPMPACATPIMEGMVVHTQSAKAVEAQKSVMEFLLINHPLDCPICDQGGECELQDLSVAYGGDKSQYTDIKRVVFDKDIGPLIQTELTRCIQCTRCVRFGEEIAGMRELGMTDRGDRAVIGTFIAKSVDSEMSGNVIDICPVGALTAKPSRFTGRAWEMQQHVSVSPHDSVGSNLYIHTLDGKVNRVVPRANESINEVWISDRDRFSYQGLYSDDRATKPMMKLNGEWVETDWNTALQYAVDGLQLVIKENSADEIACWISPNATLEEHYLSQKLVRGLGSNNIDHRLRQTDFTDQDFAPVMPWIAKDIESIERLEAILLVGSHVRKEQPLIAHRFRKAFRHHQVKISAVNPRKFKWRFKTSNELISSAEGMVTNLAGIAKAAGVDQANLSTLISSATVDDGHKAIAEELKTAGEAATIFIGNIAVQHPQYSALRALSCAIAKQTGATLAYLPEAANTAGAWLAGSVPHRFAGGSEANAKGANIAEMLDSPKKALIAFNIEPEFDVANPVKAMDAVDAADFKVVINNYATDAMKEYADVILPLSAFSETSGTYVNAEGFWQSFKGATSPLGESRPGWKVLRVLANLMNVDGFDYMSSEDVRNEVKEQCRDIQLDNTLSVDAPATGVSQTSGLQRVGDVPLYSVDSLVRRSTPLQLTKDADQNNAAINSALAARLKIEDGDRVSITQSGHTELTDIRIDDAIADDCVWLPAAEELSIHMGTTYSPIELEKA
ncbi:MAG: NADH-quinone oxidoreductase subunit G [endosymbiont of Galathealinum brachiosum]|uniref:NADH-quinone oxidoreductase n=1 Tax=endosymbiont of Galathealinum brachiosum TaxID=2200906 RepID=A0A370D8E1_9GAMM|nr:MAG: NADH-quinone oxidoreductase subunit G [endosymbiont of Galathealinum brachiosum]